MRPDVVVFAITRDLNSGFKRSPSGRLGDVEVNTEDVCLRPENLKMYRQMSGESG